MAQKYTKIPGVEGPGIPRSDPKEDKALPEEEISIKGSAGESQMPSLPSLGEADSLTLLQGLISEIEPLAQRQARAKGMEEMWGFTGKRGITPSDLPGSTVANMINVMDAAMTDPITKRINSTTDMIDAVREAKRESKSAAENSMNFFIENDMWNELEQDERQELWDSAGLPGESSKISMSGIGTSEGGIDIGELMEYKLPGFTPEWSYLIHSSQEPPEGWKDMLEQKWKSEGTIPENKSLTETAAVAEYYKIRKNLENYGNVDPSSLPQDDRVKVYKLNEELKNLYETSKTEYDEYDAQVEGATGMKPLNPVDRVYITYQQLKENNPELSSYIKLPFEQ